ncbi:hypothetical protein FRC15_006950, partial [Serendipita sp. 397]
EQWRVHRKIAAPSFTEGNNRLVYEETVVALDGLFEIWGSGDTVDINNFAEVTFAVCPCVMKHECTIDARMNSSL